MRLKILANIVIRTLTPMSRKCASCHIVYVGYIQKTTMRTLAPLYYTAIDNEHGWKLYLV
jgi:hypothetical protein